MKDHAVYEISTKTRRFAVRVFRCSDESCRLTADEIEAEDIIGEGFCDKKTLAKWGVQ